MGCGHSGSSDEHIALQERVRKLRNKLEKTGWACFSLGDTEAIFKVLNLHPWHFRLNLKDIERLEKRLKERKKTMQEIDNSINKIDHGLGKLKAGR